jgi:uncharacterized membrane protein YphA (DoxX/SURF4 family)
MVAIGRRVYGLGAMMLGAVQLVFNEFAPVWVPVPATMPGYHVLLYICAGLLILGGVAVNVTRTAAAGALVLAGLFIASMLALHLPHAIADPKTWVSWQAIAESLVMALGGVLAWTQAARTDEARRGAIARAARLAFGLCLLVFGISHFVYVRFTAAMVPAWLPPSQLIWAYATGAAQLAAGLAMLSGVKARLAALLLTIMYAAFSLLVHLPAVIHDPASHMSWAENGINLLLTGAAWCLLDMLAKKPAGTG